MYKMDKRMIEEIIKKIYEKIELSDSELSKQLIEHPAFEYSIQQVLRQLDYENLQIQVVGNEVHISSEKTAYDNYRGNCKTSNKVVVSMVKKNDNELLCVERLSDYSQGPHNENGKYLRQDGKEYTYYDNQGFVVAKKNFIGNKVANQPIQYGNMSFIPIGNAPNDQHYEINGNMYRDLRYAFDSFSYVWEERLRTSSQEKTLSPLVQTRKIWVEVDPNTKDYRFEEQNGMNIIDRTLQAANAEKDMRNTDICYSTTIIGTNIDNSQSYYVRGVGQIGDASTYEIESKKAISAGVGTYNNSMYAPPSDGYGSR